MTLAELANHVHRAGSAIVHSHAGNVRNIQPAQTVASLSRWAGKNGIEILPRLNAGNGSVLLAKRK